MEFEKKIIYTQDYNEVYENDTFIDAHINYIKNQNQVTIHYLNKY